jgi:predicted nucleotidyltransferase
VILFTGVCRKVIKKTQSKINYKRLTESEIATITKVVSAYDSNANVYLFGSRVHDNLRGGDIDLLIISKTLKLIDKINIKIELSDLLGLPKVDLILKQSPDNPFARRAIEEGVLL